MLLASLPRMARYTVGVNGRHWPRRAIAMGLLAAGLLLAGGAHADDGAAAPALGADDIPSQVRQGVVILERWGKPRSLGLVLNGDGRVLTALSPLGKGKDLDARFADGTMVRMRVGHVDRTRDLALLIPQRSSPTEGLEPARRPVTIAGTSVRLLRRTGDQKVAAVVTVIQSPPTAEREPGAVRSAGLALASKLGKKDLGSPILDGRGKVLGIVAQGCAAKPGTPCTPVPMGVPVQSLRAFLRTVPADAVRPAAWLGVRGAARDTGSVRGVHVLGVAPRSPAAKAGLKGDPDPMRADLVVALEGHPVTTPQELDGELAKRAVGDTVRVLLFGDGRYRELSVVLRNAPPAPPPQARGTEPRPPVRGPGAGREGNQPKPPESRRPPTTKGHAH